MQVVKKINKLVQEINVSKYDALNEKNIKEDIDLGNEGKYDGDQSIKNINIRLIGDKESFYFHVNTKQLDKTAISQQEMDNLYNWIIKEDTLSYAVNCNDKSKIILIRKSILFVAAK